VCAFSVVGLAYRQVRLRRRPASCRSADPRGDPDEACSAPQIVECSTRELENGAVEDLFLPFQWQEVYAFECRSTEQRLNRLEARLEGVVINCVGGDDASETNSAIRNESHEKGDSAKIKGVSGTEVLLERKKRKQRAYSPAWSRKNSAWLEPF